MRQANRASGAEFATTIAHLYKALIRRRYRPSGLPPYRPAKRRLAFCKVQALLREKLVRSVSDLVERIVKLRDCFHPDECAPFLEPRGIGC